MKKQALALTVTLILGLGVCASPSFAKDTISFRPFDMLWGVSKIYNLSLGDYEPLDETDSTWFYPEQNLNVVEPKIDSSLKDQHFVEAGDTLFTIARVNGVSVQELKEWNNLSSDLIYVGETLAIKASAAKPKTAESKATRVATTPSKKKVTTSSTNTVSAPTNTGKTLTMRATAYTAYCEGCSG